MFQASKGTGTKNSTFMKSWGLYSQSRLLCTVVLLYKICHDEYHCFFILLVWRHPPVLAGCYATCSKEPCGAFLVMRASVPARAWAGHYSLYPQFNRCLKMYKRLPFDHYFNRQRLVNSEIRTSHWTPIALTTRWRGEDWGRHGLHPMWVEAFD